MNDNDDGRALGRAVFGVRGGSGVNAGADYVARYLMMTLERPCGRSLGRWVGTD